MTTTSKITYNGSDFSPGSTNNRHGSFLSGSKRRPRSPSPESTQLLPTTPKKESVIVVSKQRGNSGEIRNNQVPVSPSRSLMSRLGDTCLANTGSSSPTEDNPTRHNMSQLTGTSSLSRSRGQEEGSQLSQQPLPFQRKLSTQRDMRNMVALKEGFLMKQGSFQRWRRRYFKIVGKRLFYAKTEKAQIYDEISLAEVTLAESTSKTFKHCFQVITPYRTLMLASESRTVMDEWVHVIRVASDSTFYETGDHHSNLLAGSHVWYATSHARPTYCNVCREQLCGVTSQGLSCEICKFKAHKRCAAKALNNCKWTTLASMGKEIIEEVDGSLSLPHQWLEGNLPVSAKCEVCERTCGSVLRLQDLRCLWCRACVHTACKPIICQKCPVGKISVVPPTALHTIGSDDAWESSRSLAGCSPLLVFVNSKSGDHQGLKFLRRFKQLLNPAQVFDLMNGGPRRGLEFFRHFEPFRILVCGGDGSVGWVMSEIDKLAMHRQCQVGVLPLGTGNDLARVLGWGASFDDDANLPHVLEKYEKATTKMLDRWSVMTFERGVVLKPNRSQGQNVQNPQISQYEDSVVSHLQNILQSDQNQTVIESAKVLCETVRDMIGKLGANCQDSEIDAKCATLSQKLDSLLQTLHEETDNEKYVSSDEVEEPKETESSSSISPLPPSVKKLNRFRQRDTLMLRANSLKKAVRQIIEHAEKAIDETTSTPPVVIVRPMSLVVSSLESDNLTEFDQNLTKIDSLQHDLSLMSPIDHTLTLPVPAEFADLQRRASHSSTEGIETKVQKDHHQSEKDLQLFPTIEVESPSSSTATKTPESELIEVDFSSSNTEEGYERASLSPPSSSNLLTVPGSPNSLSTSPGQSSPETGGTSPQNFGASPRASRRVSMGSLYKPLEVEIPKSPHCRSPFFEMLEGHSPGGSVSPRQRKTLPIVNPLVSHPSWPAIASGGIVSKVLLANADTICAVASPLMDPEDEEDLMIGFNEKCVLNNYFGIGIDAKITLDFHLKREEHPEKCRSRTKNFMWYGVLGSKEYVQQTCKNLEQRVQLECDGKRIPLPSLQGIVILNIQSFMGGTNFWGGTKEDDCFLAPSFDDRILEVVAVFDSMQMAASRLINLQHHRIAQCHSIKITLMGDDPIPVQVDGEAWLQPPGVIKIVHKNRMQMLCRNRALESSLRSWEEKLRQQHGGISPTSTENEDLDKKRHRKLFSLGKLHSNKKTSKRVDEVMPDGGSDGFSDENYSLESKEVEKWTLSDVGDWLDHMQMGEYKYHFARHDIQGAELICLQRRDLKELGVTKVGHIKRILQGIENLHADAGRG